LSLASLVLAAMGACAHAPAVTPASVPVADPALDVPISQMKGIVPSRLTNAQAKAKDAELDKAWRALKANRARAIPRIERELRELRASGRKDDFFAIDAACLLWEMAGVTAVDDMPAVVRAASTRLAAEETRVRGLGVVCEGNVLVGRAETEIVDHADKTHSDLIVLGTHGRRGLGHALLGSVAEKVVQHAHCPVLTVPRRQPPHVGAA